MCLVFFRKGLMKLYQFFTGFFLKFHFCPTGDNNNNNNNNNKAHEAYEAHREAQ